MKLSEYIANLQSVIDKHGDLDVIYSSDDEGNSFDTIKYTPTLGIATFSQRGRVENFIDLKNVEQYPDDYEEFVGKKPNAVCVN